MRAVNLLPPNAYAPKQRLPHAPVVLAASAPVLVGALLYLGYSLEHSKVVDRQNALGVVQTQIAALQPSPALASESAGVQSARTARELELEDALSKQFPWDVTFEQISRVLPSDAWLTNLSVQSPTPSGSASSAAVSPTALSIQGSTYTEEGVAHVLTRLALVPTLSQVTLGTVSVSPPGKGTKTTVQFTITASIGAAS
jgi:Tfp pilus assembly protein PilN